MWSKVGMGGEHHRYYKHTKFYQNLRGDPKFLVDLTRNDPYTTVYDRKYKCRRKYPDHLADSCKRSSVNRMAADLRLSWCIMDFFSCLQLFKHTFLNSMFLAGCRTWCPTHLQHLCCKALTNKK